MIPSVTEIEREIKKSKLKMDDMPSYIHSLLEDELEDRGDDQFRQGKDEGAAEEREKIESEREHDMLYNGCTKDQIEYAVKTIKDAIQEGKNIHSLLSELEVELCKHTPPLGLK